MSTALSRRFWLAGVASFSLAACSSDPPPRETFHRFGAPATPQALAGGPVRGTVDVPPLRTAGIVGERAILYRDGPRQVAQYNYQSWAEPPAVMVQRAIVAALRAAQAFETVTTPEMRLDRQYELMGELRQLEHVLGGTQATVVLEVEMGLRRVAGNQQLFQKTYRSEEPAVAATIDGAVVAFTRTLDKVCADLLADLATLPKQ